jgi:NAD(P)-dependent dehydrogenase (short-subunit alcohol dehydrogenase family)
MHGKVVVITGSNIGIGKETAAGIAALGATTVLACRNPEKAAAAQAEIKERTGNDDVHVVILDLADFESVRTAADEVERRWDRLDVLINNAGGIWSDRQTTKQGFEQTFAVNHLGHFLLTNRLLDRLKASAPSRVVNLSSVGHHWAWRGLQFDDLQSEKRYSVMDVYGRSKLANILFTRALARRVEGTGVTVNAVHPGPVRSGFGMDGDMRGIVGLGNRLIRPFEISPAAGAKTSIHVATAPELEGETGGYYARSKPGHMSRMARNDEQARRLWDESEKLVASAGFAIS